MLPTLSVTDVPFATALFVRLAADERRALAPYIHTQRHRRGAFLFHIGEVADQLFWIIEGIVKVSALTLDGSERLLNRSTISLLVNRFRCAGVLGGHGRRLEMYQAPARACLSRQGWRCSHNRTSVSIVRQEQTAYV
jgi:hypothetical protein